MEIWKDVPNYEGFYKVSNLGRVKSLDRTITRKNGRKIHVKEKILKQTISNVGYFLVRLCKNGDEKNFQVHQLVAMAFLGYIPNGTMKIVIDHIDNNPLNNLLSNLQVTTARNNVSKDRKNKTSKYTGVCWEKQTKKWKASIRLNGKYKTIGRFTSEEEAFKSYKKELNKVTI